MKTEKSTGQEWILAEHLDGLEKNDICDFDKLRKRAHPEEKIKSSEQSKDRGQPKCLRKKAFASRRLHINLLCE